jgi:hypothetical protein
MKKKSAVMNRPKVTLKKRPGNTETFDILWEENGVEKNVGTGQYLDTAIWFYMQEKDLDIWIDDGDNITQIRGDW